MSLKRKYQFQVFGFAPVIQEAIVPDLLKTGQEHMHQITPDKLCIFQVSILCGSPFFPFGRKSDPLFINRQDTTVRYGNFMCISAEIFNGIAKSIKGFFYVCRDTSPFHKGHCRIRTIDKNSAAFGRSRKSQWAVFVKRIET